MHLLQAHVQLAMVTMVAVWLLHDTCSAARFLFSSAGSYFHVLCPPTHPFQSCTCPQAQEMVEMSYTCHTDGKSGSAVY